MYEIRVAGDEAANHHIEDPKRASRLAREWHAKGLKLRFAISGERVSYETFVLACEYDAGEWELTPMYGAISA